MKRAEYKEKIKYYVLVITGTLLLAVSVNCVYEPLEMVTGGITGLAIVIKKVSSFWIEDGIPIWLTNILLNAPLFLAAILVKGRTFLKNTLFATISFTVALYLVPTESIVHNDYLLAAVFGGVIGGAGMGMVFMTLSSTGGTDLLAMLINKYKPYYTVPQILIVVDSLIVLAGIISFGITKSLYAVISVYITAKITDSILEGLKFAKMAYVISDYYDEIAEKVMEEMQRGITGVSATGMFSHKDKKMLFCVVSKKEIIELTRIAREIDPKSFIIISDVREVMGEGFREYRQ